MSNKPKYIKIMNDLAQKIKNNELKPGDQIPTEKELCEIYDASRMTVNKAIMMLCEKHLIERIAGKGSFVRDFRTIKNLQLGSTGSFTEDMISTGKNPGAKLIEYKLVKGEEVPQVRDALKLTDDDFIHYFIRLRTGDDLPIAISYTYLSTKVIPSLDINVLKGSLYKYIKKLGYQIKGIDAQYSAVMPTEKQKKLLEIENIALFKSQHITFLSDGTPFEYISTYYRGDQYTYSLKTFFKDEK
ncbi:hypothetical protein B5E92_10655 [Erysipelatoclostridium sp. An15]|uniref:GntR family transcriptional regulator n=1 Tax=Candidatus Erysipelatoclostridium merdavium TaxID=2838566 RepID=A0A9D1XK93_9FIRM|nr:MULTISPECIES: GntR family transcriptional regulator [unclassified Thomasclavelia]OUQ06856.1 hypothetical protein B5E92_10655 [Erysipelatoclostridium sp. An15]HIX80869.1 GntR family transcriptional regulator [Candidatus Erysipelatoclostridium merdavium]